jgi:hypothetical protein
MHVGSGHIMRVTHDQINLLRDLHDSLNEIGTWRQTRRRFGKSYIKSYKKLFDIAVPREGYDDRNALYSMSSITWYFAHNSAASIFVRDRLIDLLEVSAGVSS